MKKHLIITMLLMLLMVGCSQENSNGQTPSAPEMRMLITETNCPSLDILPGTNVVWDNRGTQPHVVQTETAEDGSRLFDSGELQIGDSFAFTFVESGVYYYQCTPDGSMKGRITVR